MDQSKKIQQKTFYVIGFNVLDEKKSFPIHRLIFQGSAFILILMFLLRILSPQTNIADKFFMIDLIVVFLSMNFQAYIMTAKKEEINEIFKELKKMVQKSPSSFVNNLSTPLFEDFETFLYKINKTQLVVTIINTIAVNLSPFLSITGHIYPMEFEIVKSRETINRVANDLIQALGGTFVCIFFPSFSMIFVNATVGVLYKIKLISKMCKTIGNKEEFIERNVPRNRWSAPMMDSTKVLKVILEMHLSALKYFFPLIYFPTG